MMRMWHRMVGTKQVRTIRRFKLFYKFCVLRMREDLFQNAEKATLLLAWQAQEGPGITGTAYHQAVGLKNSAGQTWDEAMAAAHSAWQTTKTTTGATWDDAKRVAWDSWSATVQWPEQATRATAGAAQASKR
jgi:hypothetical protein